MWVRFGLVRCDYSGVCCLRPVLIWRGVVFGVRRLRGLAPKSQLSPPHGFWLFRWKYQSRTMW